MAKKIHRGHPSGNVQNYLYRKGRQSQSSAEQVELAAVENPDVSASPEDLESLEPIDETENTSSEEASDTEASANQRLKDELQKYSKEEILDEIANLLPSIDTKSRLLALINLASYVLHGDKAVFITLRQLNGYAYSVRRVKRYVQFRIPKKKKGEYRTIDAPVPTLKHIQRCLNLIFQQVYTPHAAAHGFVPGRSVASNARRHVGQEFVYNIDLKDFFPSITSGRLFKRLQVRPFCFKEETASLIANLCCYTDDQGRNVLPQGAPTSPTITNFICERMDRRLAALASSFGLRYSRYADDITFSGMHNVFHSGSKFIQMLHHIVEDEEHFAINPDKTRLCHRGVRQEVTGLTVNSRINVSRQYVKQLRVLLHNWETKGYDEAQHLFANHYADQKTRRRNQKGETHIENVLAGKLLYLKMVKGKDDSTYEKLFARFSRLLESQFGIGSQQDQFVSDDDILTALTSLEMLLADDAVTATDS